MALNNAIGRVDTTGDGAGVNDVWEYKVYFLHPRMQVKEASPQLKARYNVAKKLASSFYRSIFYGNPLDKEVIDASLNVDTTVMVIRTKVENEKENAPKTGSKRKAFGACYCFCFLPNWIC